MKFDVHIVATASDYYAIEADSIEEAKKKMRDFINKDSDIVKKYLAVSITDWTEDNDIEITDVVEY